LNDLNEILSNNNNNSDGSGTTIVNGGGRRKELNFYGVGCALVSVASHSGTTQAIVPHIL